MSYLEALLIIRRRWRLSVPAILLALGTGSMIFLVVPPDYRDTTQVLFIGSPNQPGEKSLINPYLQLSSTMISTADVVRVKVSTAQIAQKLAADGSPSTYEVVLDQSTPAPVLIVTTRDADPTRAQQTNRAVVSEIQRLLIEVQAAAGAPKSTWMSSSVISRLPEPRRELAQSLRLAIGAGLGVLAIAVLGLLRFEGRLRPSWSPPRFRSQPLFRSQPPPQPICLPGDNPIQVNGLRPRRPPASRPVGTPAQPESRASW